MLCFNCYDLKWDEEHHKPCSKCGARLRPDQLSPYKDQRLCNWCLKDAQREAGAHECAFCKRWIKDGEPKQKLDDGRPVCAQCVEKNAAAMGGMRCYSCGQKGKYPYFSPNDKVYCENCAQKAGQTGPLHRPIFSRMVDGLKHALAER